MLVTISQITRLLKAADDTLALAENYADKGDEANAQAFATISLANSQLAQAYMLGRFHRFVNEPVASLAEELS